MKMSEAIRHFKGKEVKIDLLVAIGALVDLAYDRVKTYKPFNEDEPYTESRAEIKAALEDAFPYLRDSRLPIESEINKYKYTSTKIEAIKDLRSRTGCSLKEAKDALDKATGVTF